MSTLSSVTESLAATRRLEIYRAAIAAGFYSDTCDLTPAESGWTVPASTPELADDSSNYGYE